MKEKITVAVKVNAPVTKVWEYWNAPTHIVKWNAASDDWHTTKSTNDLQEGGTFTYRMEAKDGSVGFDAEGTYDKIITHNTIKYTMLDTRKVCLKFKEKGNTTEIIETFEAETENPIELQKNGWQAILNNFKQYAESI